MNNSWEVRDKRIQWLIDNIVSVELWEKRATFTAIISRMKEAGLYAKSTRPFDINRALPKLIQEARDKMVGDCERRRHRSKAYMEARATLNEVRLLQ